MEKMKLAELGARLPLHQTPFTLKEWRGKEEREIARARKTVSKGQTLVAQVCAIMGVLLESLDGKDLNGTSLKDKVRLVQDMYMGDAMYMYCYARREVLGPEVQINGTCPACGQSGDYVVSLDELDVEYIPSKEPIPKSEVSISPIDVKVFLPNFT